MSKNPRATLVSPRGRGAIAIVRATAPDLPSRLAELLDRPIAHVRPFPLDRPSYARLRDAEGEVIDDGVVVPLSCSTALLTLHGNPVVVEAALDRLAELGWEIDTSPPSEIAAQERGELFPDLPAGDLVASAPTVRAGAFLIDQERQWRAWITARPRPATSEIEAVLARRPTVAAFESPPRVLLLGVPNAGKSTLLNRLLGTERVVVDATPGTTRDRIEVRGQLGDRPLRWIDGAGVRAGAEAIEARGIERVVAAARVADLILILIPHDDPRSPVLELSGRPTIRVATKGDLARPVGLEADVTISARTGEGLDALRGAVASALFGGEDLPRDLAPLSANRADTLAAVLGVRRLREPASAEERAWRALEHEAAPSERLPEEPTDV